MLLKYFVAHLSGAIILLSKIEIAQKRYDNLVILFICVKYLYLFLF